MAVTITLENIDEAIVALGAVVASRKGAAPRAVVADKPVVAGTTQSEAAAPASVRKGRADKGVPRGPYKQDAKPEAASAAVTEAGSAPVAQSAASGAAPDVKIITATVLAPASDVPADVTLAAPVAATPGNVVSPNDKVANTGPSADAVQKKLEAVFNAYENLKPPQGLDKSMECLSRVGAKRGRDIKPELRQTFIEVCDDVLAALSRVSV